MIHPHDRETLAPWLKLILQRRRRLLAGALLMTLTAWSAIGLLALSGWFITATAVTGLLLAAGISVALDVYVPGGGIRAFALSRTVSRYVERVYNHDTVLRLLADLRSQVFRQLLQLTPARLGELRAVEWLNRLTTDIDTLDNLYLRLIAPPLVAVLAIALVALLIGLFLPVPALLLILGLLSLLWALTFGLARLCRRASGSLTTHQEQLRTRTVEQLQGLGELLTSQQLQRQQAALLQHADELQQHQQLLARRIAQANALGTFGVQVATVLILLTALQAYQAGWISGPVAVMMPLGTLALGEVFATLPKAFAHAGGTVAAAQRLNTLRAVEADQPPPPEHKVPVASDWQKLAWRSVSVDYHNRPVIQDFNLTVERGEKIGIVGASGCGKSTLATLLAGLQQPDKGSIIVGDHSLAEITMTSWHKQLGYLTQQTDLFNETLSSNLLLGNPDADEAALWQVLEQVGLASQVRRWSDGLETRVGEGGQKLSGGEARRVALARVMLKSPALVILDEPFSGLDQGSADWIREHLAEWLQDRTLIALAHDSTALPAVDRVIELT